MKSFSISLLWLMVLFVPGYADAQEMRVTPMKTDSLVFLLSETDRPMTITFIAEWTDEEGTNRRLTDPGTLTAELRDYRNEVRINPAAIRLTRPESGPGTGSGKESDGDGVLVATIDPAALTPGYHELVLRQKTPSGAPTGSEAGIGCFVLSEPSTNPYLCVDGALSWLTSDPVLRAEMIRLAKKSGIAIIRDRISTRDLFPTRETLTENRPLWNGGEQSVRKYDTLRQMFVQNEIPVLDMGHDTPDWTGRVGKYPADLNAASRMWGQIARHWNAGWGGFELWNEPDISFSGNMPADQYAAWVKAVGVNFPHEIRRPHTTEKTETGVETETGDNGVAPPVPLIGGVNALFHPDWLETAAQNGLPDLVDVWSFHTYATATQMEGITARYREWLTKWGHPSKPLWLTECGRPWKKGPDRAPLNEDQNSALDIAMKAIEAYAAGVERYFAFVLPYYEENDHNFGMLSRAGAPQRSLAACATVGALLHEKGTSLSYHGDLVLPTGDPDSGLLPILRARVFHGAIPVDKTTEPGESGESIPDDRYLFVFYTGKNDSSAVVDPGALRDLLSELTGETAKEEKNKEKGIRIRYIGIDGRSLTPREDGRISVPDGLTYVQISIPSWSRWPEKIDSLVNMDTETKRLWNAAHSMKKIELPSTASSDPTSGNSDTGPRIFQPLVLRYDFDESAVTASPAGYQIQEETLETLPVQITLSYILNERFATLPETRSTELEIRVHGAPPTPDWIEENAVQEVTVTRGGTATVGWNLNLTRLFGDETERWIRVSVVNGSPDESVVFRLLRRASLEQILAKSERNVPLPIAKTDQWKMVSSGTTGNVRRFEPVAGTTFMDTTTTAKPIGVKISETFTGSGDRWCYPQFRIPEGIRVEDYSGMVLRLRTETPGSVHLFLWEDGNVGWISPVPCELNGRVQTVYIRFSDLTESSANDADPNGRLDRELVRRIAIGMNPKSETMELEVLDVYLCHIPE
ncbi:MAG: glycosyl hydrolase [Planctomycetia bacterium]|nr:glycosyl hydrolase [Planctomycetia bacterium]